MNFILTDASKFRLRWAAHFKRMLDYKIQEFSQDNPSGVFTFGEEKNAWISPVFINEEDEYCFYIIVGRRDYDALLAEHPMDFEEMIFEPSFKITTQIIDQNYVGNLYVTPSDDEEILDIFEEALNGFILNLALNGAFFSPEKSETEYDFEKIIDTYKDDYKGETFIVSGPSGENRAVYIAGRPKATALELFVFFSEDDLMLAKDLKRYLTDYGKIDDYLHYHGLYEWNGILLDFYRVGSRTFCSYSLLGRFRGLSETKAGQLFSQAIDDVKRLFEEVL